MSFAFRSWVEVSRQQIAKNFRAIRAAVGPSVEVMPVVKADAYRHGAPEVAHVLVQEGARWLAVGSVEEGAALRQAGISTRILVMADFLPGERPGLLEYDLTPVIHSLESIEELDRIARIVGRPLCYHLKIDSGMGRLGTRLDAGQIYDTVRAAPHVRLEGLMTHLASPADYSSPQTNDQIRYFAGLSAALQDAGLQVPFRHASSTIAIAYGRREAWYDIVRPGHAIYGYISPVRGEERQPIFQVKPALTWKTQVVTVKDIPTGASIGYGGIYQTAKPTRIAVLSAGYADGIPHRLSNKGSVIINGKLCPMLGAVSMDLTTVDASNCPGLKPGDPVTLLGTEGGVSIDAQQIAQLAGTISYSVLCGIHARVRRVYV